MSTVIDGTVGVTTPTTGGLILQGSTSGTCTVNATAISGTAVLTMPTGTDTLVGKATTDTLTNKSIAVTQLTGTLPVANGGTGVTTSTGTGAVVLGTSPSISGAVMSTMASSVLTSATAQATTSGTFKDFTSIPSWVKRITVMLNGVSTNGSSILLVQLGTSGGLQITSYLSNGDNNSGAGASYTTGFGLFRAWASSQSYAGIVTCALVGSNIWVSSGVGAINGSIQMAYSGGVVTLGGTLDRIRITTVNGTDTFDAGSINILYE